MKAFTFKRYGKSPALGFDDVDYPTPAADELLVKVYAVGLNPIDNVIPGGLFKPILSFKLPATLGSDLSGVVVATGSRVTRFKPGDEIFASIFDRGTGSLAEFARVPENLAAMKPANLDFEQAASLPMVSLTAWQALTESRTAARAEGVHPGGVRRNRQFRDPAGKASWRKGGNDHKFRQPCVGESSWRR